MLGSRCWCPCPAIIPYRYNNATNGYEEYDIPESVEVDISFSLPQDETWIETRKDCCPGQPPNRSFGRKLNRPSSGLYSLSPVNAVLHLYEYNSRDLFIRAELSSQYLRDTSQYYKCTPWASLLVIFGSHAEISRVGQNVAPVTDVELTAALSRFAATWTPSPMQIEFTRYCQRSTPNFQNIATGECVTGEWDELYLTPLYPNANQKTSSFLSSLTSVRLPQYTAAPITADVQVPAIDTTLQQLEAGVPLLSLPPAPCWYLDSPNYGCAQIFDPELFDPQYVFPGTRLVERVFNVEGSGNQFLHGTVTINSAKAKRTGAPDIDVLDMPTP